MRNTDVILSRAACGGLKCIKPEGKNRSAKSEKCSVGDKFMQCVYQKIDTQVNRKLQFDHFSRSVHHHFSYCFPIFSQIFMFSWLTCLQICSDGWSYNRVLLVVSFNISVFIGERKYIVLTVSFPCEETKKTLWCYSVTTGIQSQIFSWKESSVYLIL